MLLEEEPLEEKAIVVYRELLNRPDLPRDSRRSAVLCDAEIASLSEGSIISDRRPASALSCSDE
jgi:hypothetical protein